MWRIGERDQSQWLPAREDICPSPGDFVQEEGCVVNAFPAHLSEQERLHVEEGVGFVMRLRKGIVMENGFAELDVSVEGGAAPAIYFRAQPLDGIVHADLYSLNLFNLS